MNQQQHSTLHRIPFAWAGAALALAGALWAATPAQAQPAQPGVVLTQAGPHGRAIPAPPPPRHEAVPRARRGQVWSPGYWDWRGRRYVWVPGTWVKARPGYRYREPHWVERDGHWELRRGGWDRDGDGVPNRHDSRPNNPYRH